MSKYDKMKRQQDALHAAEQSQYDLATRGMSELASDSKQTAEVYSHAAQVLAEIDSRFEAATSLQKADVAFLFFATALQCVRQYLITNRTDRLTDQEAAKETKGHNDEHSNRVDGDWFLPSIPEIIANPVPYDATRQTGIVKQQAALKGAGDMGHRLVLGYDPILGWVFATSTLSFCVTESGQSRCPKNVQADKIRPPESYYPYSGTYNSISTIFLKSTRIRVIA